jgi:aspartate/methionine/tyrosine aminotransferase
MKLQSYKLERYFAAHEFKTRYFLSGSDCEPLSLQELLALGDADSLRLWETLKLGYTESAGHPLLRQEIAQLYQQARADDVLVVTPEEGIFITMNALLSAGDHIIATFPGYQSLYEVARAIGCQVTLWTPQEGTEWRFDLAWLKEQIRPNTRLLVVNFPHNPTGALPSQADFAAIARLAAERGIILFSDEMYRLLEHDPRDRLPSAADLYDRAIALSGMSKTFGLAGLRLGWLVCRDQSMLHEIAGYKDYTTICSSAPSEILALLALRAKEPIIARNLRIVQDNLALLDPFFARHQHRFAWIRPRAGTIAFPRLLGGRSASDFCAELREGPGILLLPGEVYEDAGNHFRVGFGRANMPEALGKLEEWLAKERV